MTRMSRIIVAALVSALSATATRGEEIRLRRLKDGGMAAPVTVGDQELWLLVDTGSSRTLLLGSFAKRLGLTPHDRFALHTPTGTSEASCAPLSLRLGSRELTARCAGWSDTLVSARGDGRVDGVLGADVLLQYPFLLDLEKGSLNFGVEEIIGGEPAAIDRIGGRLALTVPVQVMGSGNPELMRLILDSGAERFVVFGKAARSAARGWRHRGSRVHLNSLSGTRLATQIPYSQVGDFRLEGPILLPDVDRRWEDGLLPLRAVSPVYFDGGRGLVLLRAGSPGARPLRQRGLLRLAALADGFERGWSSDNPAPGGLHRQDAKTQQ